MLGRVLVLLTLSAAPVLAEIRVEKDGEATIVRAPAAEENFLFRLPAGFDRAETPEGWLVRFTRAGEGGERAEARLRILPLAMADLNRGLGEFAQSRAAEYRTGMERTEEPAVSGEGARRRVLVKGRGMVRLVLVVRDGERLHELFLEAWPENSSLFPDLSAVADGFTILEPHAVATEEKPASPEELKARPLSHDFYRITLIKPEGYAEQGVDPNADPGLIYSFRRVDAQKNLSTITVHARLARTQTTGLDATAQAAIDEFVKRNTDPRAPRRPARGNWAGAKECYRFTMVARQPQSNIPFSEERLFLEHTNGWIYEVRVVCFGGAAKEFRKALTAFWQSLKFQSK